MRWMAAIVLAALVAAWLGQGCASSGSGAEACDFGAGGMTADVCKGFASKASCASNALVTQTQYPCQAATPSLTLHCCDLTGCTGDLSFLATPDAAFMYPLPPAGFCSASPDAATAGEGGALAGDGGVASTDAASDAPRSGDAASRAD